jgi:hypothetical protein
MISHNPYNTLAVLLHKTDDDSVLGLYLEGENQT